MVLNMEDNQLVPIFLSRPFLAIGKALIDVCKGDLTQQFNGEEVKFSIFHTMSFPDGADSCLGVDITDHLIEAKFHNAFFTNPLEQCLIQFSDNEEIKEKVFLLSTKDIDDTSPNTIDLKD